MARHYIFYILFILSVNIYASSNDSLVIYKLLQHSIQTQDKDSVMLYANKAMQYAKQRKYMDGILTVAKHFGNEYAKTGDIEKSIQLYKNIVAEYHLDPTQLSAAYNQIGIYHVYLGHYDSTETYFLKALEIRKQLKDSAGIGASLNNLGNVVMTGGNYERSVAYFIEALKIREAIKDSLGIASTTNNLGLIYYKQQKFPEAIRYYHQALIINQRQNTLDKQVLLLNNLGNVYDEINQLDSSVYYYQQAIDGANKTEDARLIAISYGNMGVTQEKKGNYDLAKKYLNKALKIRIESEDLEGQAILYNNLATVFVSTTQYDSAIYYFKKSIEFSEQIDFKEATRDNYLGLSTAYEKTKQFEKAFIAHQQYTIIKDSMLNEATNKQIAEMQTKYETEKKEKKIAEQKVKIGHEQMRVKQRNYTLYGLALILIFLLILGRYIYKQQKYKQQQLIEENKLKDKLAEVTLQNELHEERLRISRDLHDNIGSQLTFIISSVDNIKFLFKTSDEKLKEKLINISDFTRTTITQLRDTIWAMNKNEITASDLEGRISNYLKEAKLAQQSIQYNLIYDLDSNVIFTSNQGINIYRIIQEAINNAIKYSAASQIDVTVNTKNHNVSFIIEDDGIGFDINSIKLGNGLENMKNRATSIGAKIEINSTKEKGTTIYFEIAKR